MVQLTDIQGLADQIAREFRPERIILFGSHARGRPGADSDVDLLVLADHDGKDWQLAARIRERLRVSYPVDVIVRTPERYRQRVALGDPFIREVAETGVVLPAADHG